MRSSLTRAEAMLRERGWLTLTRSPGHTSLDAEFLSALRALVRRAEISGSVAQRARAQFAMLPIDRYPFAPFEGRIWQLRDQLTAHDAWYVALAEMLGTELVTVDARLRRARGPRCAVVAP